MRMDLNQKIIAAADLMQRPGGACIQELMKELNCSRKTVYKVINELQDQGVPLRDAYDTDGNTNSKRWLVREDWQSPRPVILNPQEQLALRLSLQRFRLFSSPLARRLLNSVERRIRSAFLPSRKNEAQSVFSSFKCAKPFPENQEIIDTLFECVEARYPAEVTYCAAQTGETRTYTIEPYSIVDHSGALYTVVAVPYYDHNIRVLAVDRIKAIVRAGKNKFTVPDNYNPETYLESSFGIIVEEPIRVRVLFAPSAAVYAAERVWGQNQAVEKTADGSLDVSFTASGLIEIKRWALSWGAAAKVLEPPELVRAVAEELANAAAAYSENMLP